MQPKLHPIALDPILALAAIDFVADKIEDVPPATKLFVSMIWAYGRKPPFNPGDRDKDDEVLSLCWGEALYKPGIEYVLNEMRQNNMAASPLGWYHEAVYVAALFAFRLMWAAEEKVLPIELQSGATSDIAELDSLSDDFVEMCGHALGDIEGFRKHYSEARSRFENELIYGDAACWPPFAGITRDGAAEWFE